MNIRITTLNINGLQTFNEPSRKYEKWLEKNATMKKEQIAILAIQETHLDEQPTQEIHQLFRKQLQIYNSQIGNNPRTSAGVAFIINKDLILTHDTWTRELIKGRALAIKTTWNNQEESVLINIYAPNQKPEHQQFWETIDTRRQVFGLRKPDFVLGDFNATEEAMDRPPPRKESQKPLPMPCTNSI